MRAPGVLGCALCFLVAVPARTQDFAAPKLTEEEDAPEAETPKPRKAKLEVEKDGPAVEVRAPPEATKAPRPHAETPAPGDALDDERPMDAGPRMLPDSGPTVATAKPMPPPVAMPGPTGAQLTHLTQAQKSVQLKQVDYGELLALFDARRLAVERNSPQAAGYLTTLLNQFNAMGGGAPLGAQAPDLALALTLEAHRALERLEGDRALQLATTAEMLAPSVASTHLAAARARYVKNAGDLGPLWTSVTAAIKSDFQGVPQLVRWLLWCSLAALGSILVSLLALTLTSGGRRLKLLAHDVGHVLPAPMRRGAQGALTALLLGVPVFLKAGPLCTVLWWLVWTFRYWDDVERAVAAGLVLLTLGFPYAVEVMAPLLVYPQSMANAAWLAQADVAQAGPMRERMDNAPLDPVMLGVSGLMHKRAGHLEAARSQLEHALRLSPKLAWVHNNLGCTYASMGELERAQLEFERAGDLHPGDALGLHNSATLHSMLGRTGAARDAWEAADKANHTLALAWRDRTAGSLPRPHNVAFLDAPAPEATLLTMALVRTAESQAVAGDLWRWLCPTVPGPLYPAVGLAVVLVLAALRRAGSRFSPAVGCQRCGAPACHRCEGKDWDKHHCGQCYNAFLVMGSRVEAALKIRKEVEIRHYRSRRVVWTRGLSVLWGGLGVLYAGKTLRAVMVMGVFTAGTLLAAAALLWPDPMDLPGLGTTVMRLWVLGLPVGVAYGVGMVMSFKLEP